MGAAEILPEEEGWVDCVGLCDEGVERERKTMEEKNFVPVSEKFCLTLQEASHYFNIGEKKMRQISNEHLDDGFVLQNGVKVLIKRKQFEKFLESITSI